MRDEVLFFYWQLKKYDLELFSRRKKITTGQFNYNFLF